MLEPRRCPMRRSLATPHGRWCLLPLKVSAVRYCGYKPISICRAEALILPSALPLLVHSIERRDNMMAAVLFGTVVPPAVAFHIVYYTSFRIMRAAIPVLLVIGGLATAVMFWFLCYGAISVVLVCRDPRRSSRSSAFTSRRTGRRTFLKKSVFSKF